MFEAIQQHVIDIGGNRAPEKQLQWSKSTSPSGALLRWATFRVRIGAQIQNLLVSASVKPCLEFHFYRHSQPSNLSGILPTFATFPVCLGVFCQSTDLTVPAHYFIIWSNGSHYCWRQGTGSSEGQMQLHVKGWYWISSEYVSCREMNSKCTTIKRDH